MTTNINKSIIVSNKYLLSEEKMTDISEFTISYANMRNIISEYYRQQGKNVSVNFSTQDDDEKWSPKTVTIITIVEKVALSGVQTTFKTKLTIDDLTEILNASLAKENKELVSLTDNIYSYEETVSSHAYEHIKRKIGGRNFTVKVREKEDSKTRIKGK